MTPPPVYENKKTKGKTRHVDTWVLDRTPKHLRAEIDHDYLDTLSTEERAWLSDFDKSWYCGMKTDVSKDWSKDEIKAAFDRNNARNRDIYQHTPNQKSELILTLVDDNPATGYGLQTRGINKK